MITVLQLFNTEPIRFYKSVQNKGGAQEAYTADIVCPSFASPLIVWRSEVCRRFSNLHIMSEVINPPDYYFTGINFNPAFYADDSGGGLSESTANTLYLRKTIPDTATAIETFTLGIKAQKVDGLQTSSIMYVGNNITTGSLLLGNTPIRTKNQGIFETAKIRAPATNGTVEICGDATAGGGVDIGTALSTTNINGTLNVPTSLGASSNAVNVAYLTTALANTATLNQIQTFTGTNTFNNNSVTFNRPLTVGYTIQPTSGQIGHTTYLTINSSASNIANFYLFSAAIPASNATFMCNWNFQYVLTSNATLNQPQLYLPSDPSQSNGTINLGPIPLIGQPTYYACHGSRTFFSPNPAGSMGIQLLWLPQTTASAGSGYGSCTLTRIA